VSPTSRPSVAALFPLGEYSSETKFMSDTVIAFAPARTRPSAVMSARYV
jgi:hypothetical protein